MLFGRVRSAVVECVGPVPLPPRFSPTTPLARKRDIQLAESSRKCELSVLESFMSMKPSGAEPTERRTVRHSSMMG
jgi:hypothetical protein